MLDDALRVKLRDPAYLDWHMAAIQSAKRVGTTVWYDAHFLRRFETARDFLQAVNPTALEPFVLAFDALKPPPGFEVPVLDDLFDAPIRAQILAISCEIKAGAAAQSHKVRWEMQEFGRQVVWNQPFFLKLQADLLTLVSEAVGCELRTGYNFLSLYGSGGRCDPHMDDPSAMFTLDYCIDQSDEWPIHFSKVVDWPTSETFRAFDSDPLKADADLAFRNFVLKPNQAIIFNGSSQWHYRDNIPSGGFCDLPFFHYYPLGCENLVDPLRVGFESHSERANRRIMSMAAAA